MSRKLRFIEEINTNLFGDSTPRYYTEENGQFTIGTLSLDKQIALARFEQAKNPVIKSKVVLLEVEVPDAKAPE